MLKLRSSMYGNLQIRHEPRKNAGTTSNLSAIHFVGRMGALRCIAFDASVLIR